MLTIFLVFIHEILCRNVFILQIQLKIRFDRAHLKRIYKISICTYAAVDYRLEYIKNEKKNSFPGPDIYLKLSYTKS